jgi:hypothetical protein
MELRVLENKSPQQFINKKQLILNINAIDPFVGLFHFEIYRNEKPAKGLWQLPVTFNTKKEANQFLHRLAPFAKEVCQQWDGDELTPFGQVNLDIIKSAIEVWGID